MIRKAVQKQEEITKRVPLVSEEIAAGILRILHKLGEVWL